MIERRHTRDAELRATANRTLRGIVTRYGEIASDRPERFAPFAYQPLPDSVPVNVQHRQAMVFARDADVALTDAPDALRMAARIPPGDAGDAVLSMVESRMLTGLSSEFAALVDPKVGGVRVIQRAVLGGIGVVDQPSYTGSTVELRQAGRGLSGTYRYNRDKVTRDRGKRRKQRVSPGAFSHQLTRFAELQAEAGGSLQRILDTAIAEHEDFREVQLLAGRNSDRSLASLRTGTLILRDDAEGLHFTAAALPDTSYARDLRASMEAQSADFGVDVEYRIPPADVVPDATRIELEAGTGVEVEIVDQAILTAINIVPRAPRGNRGVVDFTEQERRSRRARLWL